MVNEELVDMAGSDAAMRRPTTIPGNGVLNATVLVAAVGDGNSFSKAHDLGAWLGLGPRRHSPAASCASWVSRNAATRICVRCSSMAPELQCRPCPEATSRLDDGYRGLSNEACIAMPSWWRFPTNSFALRGLPCGETCHSNVTTRSS